MTRTVLALGDVTDPRTWSGIPYFFWKAAEKIGWATHPGRVDLEWANWPRRIWAVKRMLSGRRGKGYQYSKGFLDRLEKQIPRELLAGEILSFHHAFPRAKTVREAGGHITYYLDAPFVALSSGRGLDLRLPWDVVKRTCELDRENFALADRVITMARWAAEIVIQECGVPASKVFTILPGANLDLPVGWTPKLKEGIPGKDRPFVLGFLGADWKRKGLPTLLEVRDELVRRGWRVEVHAAGNAPTELASREGMHFAGFIDKRDGTERFVDFVAGCDVGCLFSQREALGISTLEFLRCGIPVAGYAIEGPADTLPADAGFRFDANATVQDIANRFEQYLINPGERTEFSKNAARHSQGLTWERCVREIDDLSKGSQLLPFVLHNDRQ